MLEFPTVIILMDSNKITFSSVAS